MRASIIQSLLSFVVTFFVASSAFAATISGTIYDSNGVTLGNASIQVRLWEQTPKGYAVVHTQLTGVAGTYSFVDVAAGTYKLNARMAPGFSGHYGDTWYDKVEPSSDGVFSADADELTLGAEAVVTGMNIVLPLTGGFNGRVVSPIGTPLSTIGVRAESRTDYRYHHNDFTKGITPRLGEYSIRGLRNSHPYRLIVYDAQGRYETLIVPGPFNVSNALDPNLGNHPLVAMGSDPNEPNNTAQEGVAIAAIPYQSSGAIIYPRGSDVDWYCLDAAQGDRLLARARAQITVDGETRLHPWIDPILSMWEMTNNTLLVWNDDDPNERGLSSLVDSGSLDAGRYCFAVSTFGDTNWTGTGQQTAGRYTFGLEMGNRRPLIDVTYQSQPTPRAPETILVNEGRDLTFTIVFSDPDGDNLQPVVRHLDNNGQAVQGELVQGAGGTFYRWNVALQAAILSPYELTFSVNDGEFSSAVHVIVEVEAINVPPTTPVQISPIGGVRVGVDEADLVVLNATDANGDALTYEFELHEESVDGTADQVASVSEHASGSTSWTTAAIAENTLVFWRVRAFDGKIDGGYSPWSAWESFMVDTLNEAPATPEILKPLPNELVVVTAPRISSSKPSDPEGDPVSIIFEVATDEAFATIVATSAAVAASNAANTVEWTVNPGLDGGLRYFVRAKAQDDRGAESDWSAVVSFNVRSDSNWPAPSFRGELAAQCEQGYPIGKNLSVLTFTNVDASGPALSFELHVLRDGEAVFETIVRQSWGAQTEIAIDSTAFRADGAYRIRVRTIEGDQFGDWSECQAYVGNKPNSNPDGTPTTGEDGCGCAAAGSGKEGASWAVLLLMLAGVYRLRRRR
ncbi:MAG: hypothetical protein H0U74_22330 [Bradymonadaceae bacterium]|nr:hypothetical protein [Lujinxingiaceae bacterium]